MQKGNRESDKWIRAPEVYKQWAFELISSIWESSAADFPIWAACKLVARWNRLFLDWDLR